MVIWLVGLSGSGKSTLAKKIVKDASLKGKKLILLDGDSIRDLFGNDLGHDLLGRKRNAERVCNLCAFLDAQGFDVICAILSIYPETSAWCRLNLREYFEVFIDTPLDILIERDSKKIYSRYKQGELINVVGMDLRYTKPLSANMVIDNSGEISDLLANSLKILDKAFGI